MADIFDKIVVTSIDEVFTVYSPRGRETTIKNRQTYGLSFCNSGKITYFDSGKSYVSDKDCAIILPQGGNYMLRADETGEFKLINFRCNAPICDSHIVIPISNVEPLIKEYNNLESLFVVGANKMKMLSVFYNLLHKLTICTDAGLLLPAINYIEKNYADPELSNTYLASLCGVSEVYFRKLFVEKYRTSPKQFVIDVRMNRACQLLTEGRLKVSAISEVCGFSSPYHFCRSFKSKLGMTPTEYMLKNRIMKI